MKITPRRISMALASLVILTLIIGASLHWQPVQSQNKIPIYLAVMLEREFVAGSTTEKFADSVDARNGANLCKKEINKAWDTAHKNYELNLDFYYDDNSIDTARQRVNEMLATNHTMLVVGHAFSNVSQEMGKIYSAEGIPAITASSVNVGVTKGNNWYFRALPNSQAQSHQMANYIFHVLRQKNITLIKLTGESFAEEFAQSFMETYKDLGGEISGPIEIGKGLDNNRMTPAMFAAVEQVKQSNLDFQSGISKSDPGVLVFVMRAPEAANLLIHMRDAGINNLAFGPSAFANLNFLATFQSTAPAGRDLNYYSNGVYVLAPVVFDTAGKAGQAFLQDFKAAYNGNEPGMKAATNCDALKITARALEQAQVSGEPTALVDDRHKLRDALASIDTPQEAVEGVTGKLYFDANHDPVKPIDTSIYQNGKRISAISQIIEIDEATADRLNAQKQVKNPVITYDHRFFRITDVVYVGVDINKISEMDIQTNSYVLDFYVWFRAREVVDPAQFEFLQVVDAIDFGSPLVEAVENGISYRAYHVKARFKGDFDYKNYPFDQQTIKFQIKHKFKDAQELLLVPDTIGMRGISEGDILARLNKQKVVDGLGNWELGSSAKIQQDNYSNDSTLGNPNLVETETSIPYSRISVEFGIIRKGLQYSLKNLLPLFFLVGLAQLAFFSSASDYGKMYDIVTSVILTAAFFQLGLTDSLPNIGYTTAMDWMFYIVYFLCVIQIIIILLIKMNMDKKQETYANQIIKTARWVYPLLVLLGGLLVYIQFWNG
jgi:branched-chain amino acid transport system substrate-binding protein